MRRLASLSFALVAVVMLAAPIPATGSEPTVTDVPSFNESPGCGDLDGIRGPFARQAGLIPLDEPIYGPWGDFFGRTAGLAWDQRVQISLPNMVGAPKTLWVHGRVLPALEQAIANLSALAAAGNVYPIRSEATFSWARFTISPRRAFSFHAVGASLDINSTTNPYRADNVLITDMPSWFVDAWRSAGWCWGGDWQTIKDPMHFSWKGPLHTSGYTMPPPQPPLVAPADFAVPFDLGVGLLAPAPPGSTHHVVDIDRDGAVDVVRVQPWAGGGRVALVAALARSAHAFASLEAVTTTAPVAPTADPVLADVTRDGRPDLVYPRSVGGALTLEIFALVQSRALAPTSRTTGIPFTGTEVVLFDDLNRDGDFDVFVISPGSPATMRVWLGPDFSEGVGPFSLGVPFEGHRFALGDRNVDGVRDLFALAPDGRVIIHFGPSFSSTQSITTSLVPGSGDRFFVADLDGDGHSDLFLTDPAGQTIMRRGGAATHDPRVWHRLTAADAADFNCPSTLLRGGDTSAVQVGLVDTSRGLWCMLGSVGEAASFFFGNPGDHPMTGDWNCDGTDTPGLYRRSDGFVYLRNSNTQGIANIRFFFGNPGDIPLAGDFNGDGCDTVSIYRPSTGQVFIINRLGSNDGGLGTAERSYYFGNLGDIPFVGDFDGDGVDTVGLFRPSTGLMYYRNDQLQGPATHQFFFGNPADRFVTGDWNGDGMDTPGVYRPSTRTFYLRFTNTQGVADRQIPFGTGTWIPVSGRFGI